MRPHNMVLVVLVSCLILCNAQKSLMKSHTLKMKTLPKLDVCGISKVSLARIFGGTNSTLGEFPWMAAIGYRNSKNPKGPLEWKCGGSIISDQWIVTAAHCVYPPLLRSSSGRSIPSFIRVGELDLDPSVADGASPVNHKVAKIIYHEDYDRIRQTNDIALVKTKTKIMFTDLVKPICMPPHYFHRTDLTGSPVTVAGWGRTVLQPSNATTEETTLLQKVSIDVQDTTECRRNLTSKYKYATIDGRVMCASAPGKDACQGDSGGPLMMHQILKRPSNGNWFLLGVVSYGYGCAQQGYPGVYARVSSYTSWIMDHLDV